MPRSHKMLDTMELPTIHRRIFRVILRAQTISYDELCVQAAELPDGTTATPEAIKRALADMIGSGLIQEADSASGMVYRISLGQTASDNSNNSGSGSIWNQLDSPPEKRL